jgi:hypothetical protein
LGTAEAAQGTEQQGGFDQTQWDGIGEQLARQRLIGGLGRNGVSGKSP